MSGRRLFAIFRRVAQEIRRDRRSVALLFVVPIVMTGLVTFIVREGQSPTVDAVVVNDAGARGAMVTAALDAALAESDGQATPVADEAAARAAVEDRSASIAVFLPAELGTGQPVTITLLTNGLDPSGEAAQVGAVQKAMLAAVEGAMSVTMPTVEHTTLYGVPSDDPMAPFGPAILAFLAYFFVYILTGISFLRERTGGTLERLMATPVTRGEVVLGYTLGFGLFATLQVGLLLAWSLGSLEIPAVGPLPAFSVGLGLPIAGSPLLAYLVVVLAALGSVSLGIFLSTFARTELQVIQFIPIVIVPQFLLCGVLFPVSSLPEILQPFVWLMPLTYAVDGLRQVLIAGADLATSALQLDLAVLALDRGLLRRDRLAHHSAGGGVTRAAAPRPARTGRRPGPSDTRERIIGAARSLFADLGFDGTTIRGVAARAEVDPALVHHWFGSKQQLFVAAMELPVDLEADVPRVVDGPPDELGTRIARFVLDLWELPGTRPLLLGMVRSATTDAVAARMLRGMLEEGPFAAITGATERPDADLRANLVGSQLIGLAMARYILKVEPMASMPRDALVAAIGPTLQRYLVGELSQVERASATPGRTGRAGRPGGAGRAGAATVTVSNGARTPRRA